MAPNIQNLLMRAAERMTQSIDPSPTSNQPLASSTEDLLASRFGLNAGEESLLINIVNFYSCRVSPLTLYELLCLDLYDQVSSFSKAIGKEAFQKIENEFQVVWVNLKLQKQTKEEFCAFLRQLPSRISKAHQECRKIAPSVLREKNKEKAFNQLDQIVLFNSEEMRIKDLNERTSLLVKLLSNEKTFQEILNSSLFSDYLQVDVFISSQKNKAFFELVGTFTRFVYRSFILKENQGPTSS